MIKMDLHHMYITGTCFQMCPEEEIDMREKERLLHKFEIIPETANDPKPRADREKVVKSFARSAAGKTLMISKNIRPPDVLLKTVNYLLDDVISREDVRWSVIYDFVVDRLRSVRQDVVMQNVSRGHYICILQPIIRFHVYAAYRLCEENINDFDPYMNNTHLQECLKRLLYIYDDIEELSNLSDTVNINNDFLNENRPQFEALYILLNLGNSIAITRGINLEKRWRTDIVDLALELSLAYSSNNFVRVCRLLHELPTLHAAVASLHLRHLRRNALKIMSIAYSSKNLVFPVSTLRDLLFYDTDLELVRDCRYYGLEVSEKGIHFIKASFDDSKATALSRRSQYIDQKLDEDDITTLILLGS